MKLTDAQLAARVSTRSRYDKFRRKVHRMRRLVAGDVTALDDGRGGTREAQETELAQLYREGEIQWWEILVTDIEAGRSNKLLQSVRTLAMQTGMVFPDVDFEDLDSDLSAVNSAYLKSVAARSGMRSQAQLCLGDYLVAGLGAAFVGMRDEHPVTDWVDILDVTWDQYSTDFQNMRWASWTHRRPLSEWKEMFGKSDVLKALDGEDDDPIAVECYYDVAGETGNMAYFLSEGHGAINESALIHREKNPYKLSVGGDWRPCVPLAFCHYFRLPGVKLPLSTVEMMLPAQIALWESDRRIRDTVEKSEPFYEMQEDAYTEESLEQWKDGEPGAILMRKNSVQAGSGLIVGGTVQIDKTLMEYRNMNDQEITAQGGANPYSQGNPVKGVQYAAEVNAISGAAGLTASVIAKDNAEFWQRLVKHILAVGALYDDSDITLRYPDGEDTLDLVYDKTNPIKGYLRPDADVVVSEDSMTYQPREKKVALAAANVDQAMKVGQLFPSAVQKAFEGYLRAQGIKDVAAWFEAPQQDPMALVQQGTAA